MCELFGVNANKNVDINFTWRGFVRKGEENPDGWGVGWYQEVRDGERTVSVIKQPIKATESKIALTVPALHIKGEIIISHVRWATSEVMYLNTHPFVRRVFSVGQYDEWMFAHNGALFGVDPLPRRLRPLGTTDSEAAFCYIMENLSGVTTIRELFTRLYELLDELSSYGTLNVLMSNGRYLFAYSHYQGKIMHILRRHPPYKGHVRLLDEDFEVSLGDIKAEDEYAFLVATKRLTNEPWEKMVPKRLYIFRDGALLLRVGDKIEPMLEENLIEILRDVYSGKSVGIDEDVIRLIHMRLLKKTESGVRINDYREPLVRLLIGE